MIRTGTKKTLLAAAMVAALAGCAEGNNEGGATLLGAGIGALTGAAIGGHGSGAALGAMAGFMGGAIIGNKIGRNMDEVDRMRWRDAQERAYRAPIGEDIVWNNPSTGNSGRVRPIRDGRSRAGAYCREFQTEVTISGRREDAFGRACQQPDGSWKIVEG